MSRRVLVVDDDPALVQLLCKALTYDGHAARGATQSLRAFDAAVQFSPDLVLMDIVMPYLSGFDQIKLLSLDERLSTVPVLVMTARRDALNSVRDLRAMRIVDCVYKPFDVSDLLQKVALAPRPEDLRSRVWPPPTSVPTTV
jgi:two-component system OmpR family response regulator